MKALSHRVGGLATLVSLWALHGVKAVSIDMPTTFADFSSQDVKTTIQNIVRIIIGFLGILVICAILFGGFMMMTSGGDADKTGNGQKIVVAGAIGLVIVLAAFAISTFVINSLVNAV